MHGKLALLFSNAGAHPAATLDRWYSPGAVEAVFWLWLIALLALLVGAWVRGATVVNLLCAIYFFLLRGRAAPHGADGMYLPMAFYLLLMRSDRLLSLRARLRPQGLPLPPGPIWPLRLARLQVASVYFASGLDKLGDPGWRDGSALADMFRHPLVTYFGPVTLEQPVTFLTVATHAVVLWELVVPFLLLFAATRRWAVASAVAFHVTIAATLRVGWFSETMLACCLLFLGQERTSRAVALRVPQRCLVIWATHVFLLAHLGVFLGAQIDLVARAAGVARPWSRALGRPPLEDYLVLVGATHLNVFPTRVILRPVRYLFYEAVLPGGEALPIEPFDAAGRFAPGLRYAKEVREWLLALRAASGGLTERGWRAYSQQLLRRFIQRTTYGCPSEIRLYRVRAAPEQFGGHAPDPRTLGRRLLTAGVDCEGEPTVTWLDFTPEGRPLVLADP
jgi:hypothetical protein